MFLAEYITCIGFLHASEVLVWTVLLTNSSNAHGNGAAMARMCKLAKRGECEQMTYPWVCP